MNQEYKRWLTQETLPQDLRDELISIEKNDAAIQDRFWRHLEFGTGGLRGIIGAGINRMNVLTVGRASQGFSDYLNQVCTAPSICIAYDTRNMSYEFACAAAQVFCANGIQTYLFEGVRPTPMLSFAVRYTKASAGVVITASHNPREYNGYKVYGADGGQITDTAAANILNCINTYDVFNGIKQLSFEDTKAAGLLHMIGEDIDAHYYEKVKALILRGELVKNQADSLSILYSPLHGSGNIPVRRVLNELGFSDLRVVPEQELPDGNFPTAPYPNPEEPSVYELAIGLAKKSSPDLIFATDPDCDRIGVLVKDDTGAFVVLTGNQMGALLCDYIIMAHKELGTLPSSAAIIKTIVTTDLAKSICEKNGVTLVDTLTGFKYIGEKVGEWDQDKKYSFLFGFEESYGYLSGSFVRDKDAVIAAVLIAEMALYYKIKGMSLFQALHTLYEKYGYTQEKLTSILMPGQEGQEKISALIANLRENYKTILIDECPVVFEDYKQSLRVDTVSNRSKVIDLPKSNVLKFIFRDDSWLVLRPSGTEPKIKAYLAAVGSSQTEVAARLLQLEGFIKQIL